MPTGSVPVKTVQPEARGSGSLSGRRREPRRAARPWPGPGAVYTRARTEYGTACPAAGRGRRHREANRARGVLELPAASR